jgi:hypothetical protein
MSDRQDETSDANDRTAAPDTQQAGAVARVTGVRALSG